MRLGFVSARLSGSGPQEIPTLDGVRALAALSVLFFHSFESGQYPKQVFNWDISVPWNYAQTGVHLFFVLSGFLLFLPYARAMLQDRPLPAAGRFYQRRALRILPAYWVCMIALVVIQWPSFASPTGATNIAAHTVLLHDDFRLFNRSIEGPFWTLAIEVQFYALLPLLAAGVARVVGRTQSALRLILGVLALLVGALAVRGLDALTQNVASQFEGAPTVALTLFVRATMGMQGKFLEVFALGMLCSVLHLAMTEQWPMATHTMRWLGLGLLGVALMTATILAPALLQTHLEAPAYDLASQPGNWLAFFSPFLVGLGYSSFLLAVLWIGGGLSALFASAPLRFLGVMSYSLYLWHMPIVQGTVPLAETLPVAGRVLAALVVAYLSYRILERPFLRRKERTPLARPEDQTADQGRLRRSRTLRDVT
jgi:peptidoglycan/LPS O-acetylase OafA/YrhL